MLGDVFQEILSDFSEILLPKKVVLFTLAFLAAAVLVSAFVIYVLKY
jgi:hypothetical protein